MSDSVVSEENIKLLTGASNPDLGDIKKWDPQEVHRSSIFYAGQRSYLCPSIKIGSPDALTPEEGLGIPMTRASRTEAYRQKEKLRKFEEARKKMTKAEIEEEQRKSEQALASFVKVNSQTKKTRLPDIEHRPQKTEVQISKLMDKLVLEDPAQWEQIMQAGCAFWRNIVTREVRVAKPRMMGEPKDAMFGVDEPEEYPLGTGSPLFDKEDFLQTRSWLVENRGMPLPDLVPKVKKRSSFTKPPPTAEQLQEIQQHRAAKVIQQHLREFVIAREEERKRVAEEGDDGSGSDYDDDDYSEDE